MPSCARLPLSIARPLRMIVTRVGERLGLAEDVTAQQNRAACLAVLVHALEKRASMSGSSPEVGSSSSSNGTSLARAATRATFWRLP